MSDHLHAYLCPLPIYNRCSLSDCLSHYSIYLSVRPLTYFFPYSPACQFTCLPTPPSLLHPVFLILFSYILSFHLSHPSYFRSFRSSILPFFMISFLPLSLFILHSFLTLLLFYPLATSPSFVFSSFLLFFLLSFLLHPAHSSTFSCHPFFPPFLHPSVLPLLRPSFPPFLSNQANINIDQ